MSENNGLAGMLYTGSSWNDPSNPLYSEIIKSPEALNGLTEYSNKLSNIGVGSADATSGFSFSNMFKDKNMLGNIAGLASTFGQLAALPSMIKNTNLQNDSLKFNLNTAKQEQAARTANKASFNSFTA